MLSFPFDLFVLATTRCHLLLEDDDSMNNTPTFLNLLLEISTADQQQLDLLTSSPLAIPSAVDVSESSIERKDVNLILLTVLKNIISGNYEMYVGVWSRFLDVIMTTCGGNYSILSKKARFSLILLCSTYNGQQLIMFMESLEHCHCDLDSQNFDIELLDKFTECDESQDAKFAATRDHFVPGFKPEIIIVSGVRSEIKGFVCINSTIAINVEVAETRDNVSKMRLCVLKGHEEQHAMVREKENNYLFNTPEAYESTGELLAEAGERYERALFLDQFMPNWYRPYDYVEAEKLAGIILENLHSTSKLKLAPLIDRIKFYVGIRQPLSAEERLRGMVYVTNNAMMF